MLSSGIGESGWDAGRVPEGDERTLAARRRDARAKMSRPRTWLPDERTHRAWMPWTPLLAVGRARFFSTKNIRPGFFPSSASAAASASPGRVEASEKFAGRPRSGVTETLLVTQATARSDRAPAKVSRSVRVTQTARTHRELPPRPRPGTVHRPIKIDRLARSDEKSWGPPCPSSTPTPTRNPPGRVTRRCVIVTVQIDVSEARKPRVAPDRPSPGRPRPRARAEKREISPALLLGADDESASTAR